MSKIGRIDYLDDNAEEDKKKIVFSKLGKFAEGAETKPENSFLERKTFDKNCSSKTLGEATFEYF